MAYDAARFRSRAGVIVEGDMQFSDHGGYKKCPDSEMTIALAFMTGNMPVERKNTSYRRCGTIRELRENPQWTAAGDSAL